MTSSPVPRTGWCQQAETASRLPSRRRPRASVCAWPPPAPSVPPSWACQGVHPPQQARVRGRAGHPAVLCCARWWLGRLLLLLLLLWMHALLTRSGRSTLRGCWSRRARPEPVGDEPWWVKRCRPSQRGGCELQGALGQGSERPPQCVAGAAAVAAEAARAPRQGASVDEQVMIRRLHRKTTGGLRGLALG